MVDLSDERWRSGAGWSRWLATLAVLFLGVGGLACSRGPSVEVTHWELAVDGQPPRGVVFPTRLPVPDRPMRYVLSADVALAPEMRGHAASLTFVDTFSVGELRVDSRPALSCLGPRILGRHGTGSLCWHFVVPD